jgi:hypothetical protein
MEVRKESTPAPATVGVADAPRQEEEEEVKEAKALSFVLIETPPLLSP